MSAPGHEAVVESPRIIVVDASRVTRTLIEKVILEALPDATVEGCETAAKALDHCETGAVDLVTSSLSIPDMDGLTLCRQIREATSQRYIPIILISGEVNDRVIRRDITDDVTDYFDKSHGFKALGAFIRGYICPDATITGHVLYVEDSKVVALATRRMLESSGLTVTHVVTVEEALELIDEHLSDDHDTRFDLVLTDVYLKGGLTGNDLLADLRTTKELSRREMPILVMTGDDNPANQSALLKAGANDLVEKPIEEKTLINKLRFQLAVSKGIS